MDSKSKLRLPIMVIVLVTLLAALWAALYRVGWQIPVLRSTLPMAHGPLMLSGLLGTVIALERAVAIGQRWTYLPPLFSALGSVVLIIDGALLLGPLLIAAGSLGFLAVSAAMVRRVRALYTITMGLGALSWLVGNILWVAGSSIAEVVYWWAGFIVLTIVGERLELSRIIRPGPASRYAFLLALVLTLAGTVVTAIDQPVGARLASLGYIALAAWLVVNDVARRTVRRSGITRFIAVNLLLGYFWLLVSGILGLWKAGITAGPYYDAILHSLFMGFVLSMIFAHSLIILPAVTGLQVPFKQALYGPVILLHLSLGLRVIADLNLWQKARMWGGLLNVTAVLWFLLMLVGGVLLEQRAGRHKAAQTPGVNAGVDAQ